ncbi:MAG: biopolymer transporter ExbD [Gammaproteobacteria bacterium]|nr:biopolymer transporter ExbD [Gammaproteobacteria bacterium]
MNFRPQKNTELELNLTPMIDVVFLLLIFFMVSTTFDEKTEMFIELPEVTDSQPKEKSMEVILSVAANGDYYVNQKKLVGNSLEDLTQAVLDQAREKRTLKLLINADANTPHQSVMTALEAASRAGISNVGFAAAVVGE